MVSCTSSQCTHRIPQRCPLRARPFGHHPGGGFGTVQCVSRRFHNAKRGIVMGVYRAEYIWIDGTQPTQKLRSKTKIVPKGEKPPIWGFDGSSTQQATGDRSDCVLQPVFTCPDPIRGRDDVLVLCEVMLVN